MPRTDFVKSINFFGHAVYSPFAALCEPEGSALAQFLDALMTKGLGTFGLTWGALRDAADEALDTVSPQGLRDLEKAEDLLRRTLRRELVTGGAGPRAAKLAKRATTLASQVVAALRMTSVLDQASQRAIGLLDVGCGDGRVALELSREIPAFKVDTCLLLDVLDYRAAEVKEAGYGWIEMPPDYEQFALKQRLAGPVVSATTHFDVVLLITVLHHSQMPSRVFRSCAQVTKPGGVIVVIESCVDVASSDLQRLALWGVDDSNRSRMMAFASLGRDSQLRYAAFVDWFYNRVIQVAEDVYVPCNFGSVDEWTALFDEFARFSVATTMLVGFDQPLVPEFHTIHVVQREA